MSTHVHVRCPSCGTTLRAEDMSLQTMAGRCHACHALVDLRPAMTGAGPDSMPIPSPAADAEPLPVPLPGGLIVGEAGGDLTIVRRWFSWVYIFLAFFCLFWDGFLVFWYAMAFQPGAPLVMKVFPLLHVGAGVFITYMTIAGFVNRTTFIVHRGLLSVRHGPLPWRGNLDVPTDGLAQLFCTEKISRGKNGTTVRYDVEAVLKDGRHLPIVRGLDDRDQALYIEQTLEKHLGIADRRVRSEMARGW